MKFNEQKPGHFWWKQNTRYTIYIIRELSGVMIALFIISLIALPILEYLIFHFGGAETTIIKEILHVFLYIGFIGSLIHTLTWLYVMPQLLPIKLTPLQQKIAYVFLLGIWLGISYLLLMLL